MLIKRRKKEVLGTHFDYVTEHQQLERQRSFSLVLYRHLVRGSLQRSQVDMQLISGFRQNGGQPGVRKLQVDRRVSPRVEHTVVAVAQKTNNERCEPTTGGHHKWTRSMNSRPPLHGQLRYY